MELFIMTGTTLLFGFYLLRSIKTILVSIPTTYLFPYQLKSCFPLDTQRLFLCIQQQRFMLQCTKLTLRYEWKHFK